MARVNKTKAHIGDTGWMKVGPDDVVAVVLTLTAQAGFYPEPPEVALCWRTTVDKRSVDQALEVFDTEEEARTGVALTKAKPMVPKRRARSAGSPASHGQPKEPGEDGEED